MTWTIPSEFGDASSFKYLSLRIGQLDGATVQDLQIQLLNHGQEGIEVARARRAGAGAT